ncbi:hypothetical protein [Flavobacterium sp. NRK1]|uniref:hypothetical protein n=1 Tax=Flavobacterium sp. NRK1 TaxID=2954929 RepID=UPI002093D74A|nr:hypothetical protein [Flavobacterium sp. NRK1]MCO6148707.1 hypothetical protein [Flavobacterium sp. NRK1]
MKTILQHIALFTMFLSADAFAQDITTVRANNSDISDNLDLKAVASIFGDSSDLEDFERRLNNPETQISNLDLNGDNRVDYLRVIEANQDNTHLIIIQAVLGADTFQDVATIEVERDRNNNVQVQVVGDVYMYGSNYIYEPVYVYRPAIFDIFWVSSYRPYYSPWYWGYYPTYYSYWAPYPVYRYRHHVHTYINPRNTYVYANTRRSSRAAALYSSRRQNDYERLHPNTSFSSRNDNVNNRYALEQSRGNSRNSTRANRGAGSATRSSFTNASRSNNVSRSNINTVKKSGTSVRSANNDNAAPRTRSSQTVRNTGTATPSRSNRSSNTMRTSEPVRTQTPQPAKIERSAPSRSMQQQSTPLRSSTISTPSRSSAPSMRSIPAPARQNSAPARSSGGNSRRG